MKRIFSLLLIVGLLTLSAMAHGGHGGCHNGGRSNTERQTTCASHQANCAGANCYANGSAACPVHGAGCQGYGCPSDGSVCATHGTSCPGACSLVPRA